MIDDNSCSNQLYYRCKLINNYSQINTNKINNIIPILFSIICNKVLPFKLLAIKEKKYLVHFYADYCLRALPGYRYGSSIKNF